MCHRDRRLCTGPIAAATLACVLVVAGCAGKDGTGSTSANGGSSSSSETPAAGGSGEPSNEGGAGNSSTSSSSAPNPSSGGTTDNGSATTSTPSGQGGSSGLASGGSANPPAGGGSAVASNGGSSAIGQGGRAATGGLPAQGGRAQGGASAQAGRGGAFAQGGRAQGGAATGGVPAKGGAVATSAAGASTTPSDVAAQYVDATNAIRAAVTQPANYSGTWAPLPNVTWSDTVAASAQAWANTLASQGCALNHESQNTYGENLAMGTNLTPKAAVDLWASEQNKYTYSATYTQADFNAGSGHYTQLVWRKSITIGCGSATCSGNRVVISCRYSPPGNVLGQSVY